MSYTDTPTGDPANAIAELLANTERLREAFIGPSAPAAPDAVAVEGQFWVDNSSDPHVLNVFIDITGGGSPVWLPLTSLVFDDMDVNLNQLVNARLENLGSDMTPSAGNIGRPALHTTKETLQVVLNSGTLGFVSMLRSDQFLDRPGSLESWSMDGTNPPTLVDVAMGVAGSFRGRLFDAVNERMSKWFKVPIGWVGNADCKLRVTCLLNASQLSGDDIEAEANWIKMTPGSADVATKNATNSQLPHDIGAIVGQYTSHVFDIVIDHDVAANVMTAGDLLNVEFGLYGIGEVTGIIVTDAELLFPAGFSALET